MQPIGFIRLIGHTDNTGPEKYNVDLGDRRARAVKEELESILNEDILKGRIRIAILVDPGPGASAPNADNRTKEGRARNRRVEVFITTGVATPTAAPTPPEPPIDLRRAARDAAGVTARGSRHCFARPFLQCGEGAGRRAAGGRYAARGRALNEGGFAR